MDAKDYTVRCDKHNFKPYEYCEICMIRTKLQNVIETDRKEVSYSLNQTHLAIQVLNECFDKLHNKVDEIRAFLVMD